MPYPLYITHQVVILLNENCRSICCAYIRICTYELYLVAKFEKKIWLLLYELPRFSIQFICCLKSCLDICIKKYSGCLLHIALCKDDNNRQRSCL